MAKQNSFGFNVPIQIHADDPPIVYDPVLPVAIEAAKAGIRDASLEAYQHLRDTGKLNKQESIIIRALNSKSPMTGREIQKATGMDINAVSGRVNDLKKKKVLVETPRRVCRVTGRVVTPVRVNR